MSNIIQLFQNHAIKLVAVLLLLVGCTSSAKQLPNTIVPASSSLTITSPTPTSTMAPTVIMTSTATHIPLTLTPLPTLLPQEAQELILDLLINNAGCRLPCWWGVIPGETPWETTHQFLATFVKKIGQGGSGPYTEDGITYHSTNYSAHYQVPGEDRERRTLYSVRDGIIISIAATPQGRAFSYTLALILTTYGQPSEIWMHTFSEMRGGVLPFGIMLFYPALGIRVSYLDLYASAKEGAVHGCFYGDGGLKLWSPDRQSNSLLALDHENATFWPLEKATGIDIETFYLTYKDSNYEPCLETPAKLWPSPP